MQNPKFKNLMWASVVFACSVLPLEKSLAQQTDTFKILKSISLPGDTRWDYLIADPTSHRLYISRQTNVLVVDLNTEKVVGTIPKTMGVHGIALANKFNKGFTSNGKTNSVTVFNLETLKVTDTIALQAKGPDAIMFDPFSARVFVFNGHTDNATIIDAQTNKIVGTVDLGGGPEFAVTDGKGHVYNNLEDKNEVVAINATTLKVEKRWPLNPGKTPTGLAIDVKNNRLFSVCRENKGMTILNAGDGKVLTTLPIGGGTDAAAYDPDTKTVFSSNGDGTLTVIMQTGADNYKVVQNLATQRGARTMALDPNTHKIYLPAAEFGVDKKVVPGSFKLLVVGK